MSDKKKAVKAEGLTVVFNQNVKFNEERYKAGDYLEVSQEEYEILEDARVINKKDD